MYPLLKASDGAAVVNIGSIVGGSRAMAGSKYIQWHKTVISVDDVHCSVPLQHVQICVEHVDKDTGMRMGFRQNSRKLCGSWTCGDGYDKRRKSILSVCLPLANVCVYVQMIENPAAVKVYEAETPMRRTAQSHEIASKAIPLIPFYTL